jgi:C-terminal processing protease CtpA/Prc
MRGFLAIGIASCAFLLGAAESADTGLKNAGFEEGTVGKPPPGWILTTSGSSATVVDDEPTEGKRCVRVGPADGGKESGVAVLLQSVDAKAYRGKAIRFRAALRVDNPNGQEGRAQLWVRVDRAGDRPGFFDNMNDRPVRSKEWVSVQIAGDVAADAEEIYVGLLVFGGATVRLDATALEISGEAVADRAEGPRPIEGRGLDNLVAFTRLLGYIRHFHPSDESAAADWDRFAVAGVLEAEPARDVTDLANRLQTIFAPVAPTVRVFPTGQVPPAASEALTGSPDGPGARVVWWVHHGFAPATPLMKGYGNIYRSRREEHALEKGKAPDEASDPSKSKMFTADLGGGVSCLVPLALFADDNGTLPVVPRQIARPNLNGKLSGDDRATRLADVVLIWNVIQHFYPYFDVVEADWPGVLRSALTSAASDKDAAAFHTTLRRLVAAYHDGHGNAILSSEAAKTPLPISWDWVERKLVVTNVEPDLQRTGIRRGTVIRAINGRPAAEALVDAERLISAATPQWARWNALRTIALGAPGSQTTLEIEDAEGGVEKISLRHPSDYESVTEARPPKIHEVKPGIYYVDTDRVSDADLRDALPKLEKARGIVFDFRGYPSKIAPETLFGHLIDHTVKSPQWNVPVFRKPDRKEISFERLGEWTLTPQAPYLKAKRAFIIDGRAISYAESCLGIVEHEHLGAIVGSPTAGTNGNINIVSLPGGYRVIFTGMKVLKHDGARHHGVGILPTVPVSRTVKAISEGKDELLEKAIQTVENE